jgi:hypothetical protein
MAIIVILVALALLFRIREIRSDSLVLRHTIAVNLSILKSELEELFTVANQSEASQAVIDARAFLTSAATAARNTESRLNAASKRELGALLANAFQAMQNSTRARHLLNACWPRGEF